MATSSLGPLTRFRKPIYQLFMRRRDGLFDLTDALLTTGPILSPTHLSLASSFQRGWGSVYDALVGGQIDDKAVEALLSQHPLEAGEPIYAVDASVWARSMPKPVPNALFTIIHPVTRLGNRLSQAWPPIGLERLSFAHDSWTAPRKIHRLKPEDLVNLVAVEQIKELLQDYPESVRSDAGA
jgi:hypothetical protein